MVTVLDVAVISVPAQLVDGDLGVAKTAARIDPEIVPEAIRDHLDEVNERAQGVKHERIADCRATPPSVQRQS